MPQPMPCQAVDAMADEDPIPQQACTSEVDTMAEEDSLSTASTSPQLAPAQLALPQLGLP